MKLQFNSLQLNAANSFWEQVAQKALLDHRPSELQYAIREISNTYAQTQKDRSSLWNLTLLKNAYLSYFLPLNVLRNLAVLQEAARLNLLTSIENIFDFGCGPGTFEWALLEFLAQRNLDGSTSDAATDWAGPKNLYSYDKSKNVKAVYTELCEQHSQTPPWKRHWLETFPKQMPKNSMTVFSYALTELDHFPKELFMSDVLLILEPSNQDTSRRLQGWRNEFLEMGYHLWAPCTHDGACPLLKHSKTDWCHQRIHAKIPKSFHEIHKGLPMQNDSLTYSYLLLSKTPRPQNAPNLGRTIGDTLYERGKVKQAFCRNEDREFLSWLTRHGEPDPIPRGSLIELPPSYEIKGGEIRLTEKVQIRD